MSAGSKWATLVLGIATAATAHDASAARVQETVQDVACEARVPKDGHVIIKLVCDRIFIREVGSDFEEFLLNDSSDAARLRKLLGTVLPEGGTLAVPIGSSIVA